MLFQPSPVRSSGASVGAGGHGARPKADHGEPERQGGCRKRRHSPSPPPSPSSSFVLADSSHPVLDGAGGGTRSDSSGGRGVDVENAASGARSHYPTESDFAGGEDGRRVRAGAGDRAALDVDASPDERREGDRIDDNSSEDGGDPPDDGAAPEAEMPTLDSYVPREPSYEKANAMHFAAVCKRLETLWSTRIRARRAPRLERVQYLLTDELKSYLEGGSPYPYLRLVLPDHDSARPQTGMKEAKIAEAWARALGLAPTTRHHRMLVGYRNSGLIRDSNAVGDLSCVVRLVMDEREPGSGSRMTVGEANEWLDAIVDVARDERGTATAANGGAERSEWRRRLDAATNSSRGKAGKYEKYAILVERLIGRNLSPVEHKFMVRILLQHVNVGINRKEIMRYMDPYADEIYESFNSLKAVCTRLCDPGYMRLLKATKERNAREIMESNRKIWMTPSTLPATIQRTISPMLSRRTMFHTFLKEIAHRHGQLDKALPAGSTGKGCMAIRHPAFTCEIKMDGERDLVHIRRGIVTVQTRNGTWYSPLYSPAIGPSLRAAVAGYDVDVVLDGEMIAWDSEAGRPVPFGSNRSVAEKNRNRRRRDGTLDPRDLHLHEGEADVNVMTVAKSKDFGARSASSDLDGVPDDRYWLQYVVFDILYLDGPDAKELINKSRVLFSNEDEMRVGSLINMDCMQRKSILYNLIRPQDRAVEHIRSFVIRPDGSNVEAPEYFLGTSREYGRTPCEMDSIQLALCDNSGTTKFDAQRMGTRNNEEIEVQRSMALESLYHDIVDDGGQEGLIFKDLASPYYLGAKSRSMGYWWKLKPDYDESGLASDIDLLVLGGRYATGFDKRGMVGSLILGCLDQYYDHDDDEDGDPTYMVVTKVNFNRDIENTLYDNTGYQRSDENGKLQLGKWFESEENPDFIASTSYQRSTTDDKSGWKSERKDRPDIWIRPQDSFVVTVNAGEFVRSSSMQTGLTLRFPRISRYRGKGSDDPKAHDQVNSCADLYMMFQEQDAIRQDDVQFGSQGQERKSRFLTEKQLQKSGKQKTGKRKQTNEVKKFQIPMGVRPLSKVLEGFIFCVQPGNYSLENDAFAAKEAREGGWAADAGSVRSRDDVVRYIQSHGGQPQLTVHGGTDFAMGGMKTDAKVANFAHLMNRTDVHGAAKKEAEARRLIEMGGILKWTFVYAIVSKFLKRLENDASGYEHSIKKDWPRLAQPRRKDFLVLSNKASFHSAEDDYGLSIDTPSNLLDFTQALEEVGRRKKGCGSVPLWQILAYELPANERWVFGGKVQKLWPYQQGDVDSAGPTCVLYPDLFSDPGFEEEEEAAKDDAQGRGKSPRWKGSVLGGGRGSGAGDVAAALPLARAMGAVVTSHLHEGVTHVLCSLKRRGALRWSSTQSAGMFTDDKSGARLHERLTSLEESAALAGAGHDVMLVSPVWLEERWNA